MSMDGLDEAVERLQAIVTPEPTSESETSEPEAERLEAVRRLEAKMSKRSVELSKGLLDRSPKKNWVEKSGGLPSYIEDIAHDLHTERGMDISHAIAVAISMCKKWAAGGKNVKPDTRLKAAAAIVQWEALKAKSHAD